MDFLDDPNDSPPSLGTLTHMNPSLIEASFEFIAGFCEAPHALLQYIDLCVAVNKSIVRTHKGTVTFSQFTQGGR